MKGLHLKSLNQELNKVEDKFALEPARTVQNIEEKNATHLHSTNSGFDSDKFFKNFHRLSAKELTNFTFEDVCKLCFSSVFMMERTVEKLFETIPSYEVVRKIKSSWWRWGMGTGNWNELVDVYNGIRSFNLDLPPEFSVRLDYSTGYNPHGHSRYSRTYLDGVFAFLLYYRGEHVMTISFSVMQNRRLLIQQVQLKQSIGNRWLYKLNKPRLELAIEAFTRSFPDFSLFIVDGQSLMKKTATSYQVSLQRAVECLERHDASNEGLYSDSYIESRREEATALKARIAHIESDTARLAHFYANCGAYSQDGALEVNYLLHRKLKIPA
ncbi:hypothetical protein K2P47_03375 [Patescibacteria group bacterium]|nr:hypothetical protein [Patescibacteria group bacterium]